MQLDKRTVIQQLVEFAGGVEFVEPQRVEHLHVEQPVQSDAADLLAVVGSPRRHIEERKPMRAGPKQYANINFNTSGTHVVRAGQAGMRVHVVSLSLLAAGAVIVTMEDTLGADRMGPYPFAANGGIALPDGDWCRTANGQGLNIRLSTNERVGGSITYRLIPHHMDL